MFRRLAGLSVTTPSDREIRLARAFDAPSPQVFDAFTKPEWVRRWLLGPEGWTMVVCEIDLRVGGAYRYAWQKEGEWIGVGGVYREIAPPRRLVSTESFETSWYPGEAVSTLELTERGGRTAMTMTLRYESREARDVVLQSPMAEGVAAGYDRLDRVLAEEA